MTIQGKLKIVGGQAFITPDPGQPLTTETLIMMKDLPPGGSPTDRIDAAPDYFRTVRGKNNGDPISVTGELQPFGQKQVLEIIQ